MESYLLCKETGIQELIKSNFNPSTAFVLMNSDLKLLYILVFTDCVNGINAANISKRIIEQTNNEIQVILLLHKLSDLNTKQSHQQRFFDRVLKEGRRICFDKSAYPFLPVNTVPDRDWESDKNFWLKCVAVAQFNIQAAKDSGHLEVELCRIALLNTACVQLALGLIRIFMEYTPNEFGLRYLLDLCGYFTDVPSRIFNKDTPENARRFKMLCAPPSMLNHWTKLNANQSDFLILLDATQQFQSLATELVTKELNSIQQSSIIKEEVRSKEIFSGE